MNIYPAKLSQEKDFYVYFYIRKTASEYGNIGMPYYVGKGRWKQVQI